jgi:undecaprenyl-diphosphatase
VTAAGATAAARDERRVRLVEGRLRRRLVPLLVAEAVVVTVLAILVFHSKAPNRVDRAVADAVYARPGTALRTAATAVTFFGSSLVVPVLALGVAALTWRHFRDVLLSAFCPLAVASAVIAERALKSVVARDRPATAALAHELDFSYPSGHVTAATALAIASILLVLVARPRRRRALVTLAVAYALLVAASRLVLGVHYLSDVVGAALLASAGVLLTGWLCSLRAVMRRPPA